MGSQGGGGTMSSSSASSARDKIKEYGRKTTPADVEREKVEKLAKEFMGNVFKKKETAQ